MAKAPAGLMVVPGMEITSEVGDIIALFIHKPIEAVDLEGIVREVRAQDGLLYLPHPFRGRRSLSLELVKNMDVFEVLNGRSQGIDYNNDQFGDAEIVQFAQEYGLCGMGGSDAHKSHEQHRVLTYVPDFEDLEELKAHLRSGVVFPIWKDNDWWAESLEASGHPAFQS
jgi:predicted metal-dependent phosphoesterase TrpH